MGMIRKISFLLLASIFAYHLACAQDFKKQYKIAKDLFKEGKYNLAMEAFKPLLVYDKNNPYIEYASFFYAQSALKQGYKAVAKDMLLTLRRTYPDWDQMNEVNFWLSRIYFEDMEYFQGMRVLTSLRQEDYIEKMEVMRMKRFYLSKITDPEILRMMWEEYPQDAEVGKALARSIALLPFAKQDHVLLDSLILFFQLPRDQYASAVTGEALLKDQYEVAVMFPFLAPTLEPTPTKKQNQLILDLYEGMRMAKDTLKKMGVQINLRAYDTQRTPEALSPEPIRKLLETEELKGTDLIVGPLFFDELKQVKDFSEKNQINMINPVSNNQQFVGTNPFGFLFQPSLETMGIRSAEHLAARLKNKNCVVMYGDTPKDSIMATAFSRRAMELGMNIVWEERFRKETAARIISILATPTEYDEFKNPKQFKMKLDSIGSVYVASDNPLIYTKVISSVETRGDSVIIVGSESWIDNPSVDLGKYEKLHVLFTVPNLAPMRQPNFLDFRKRFIKLHGAYPPEYMNYARVGFEFMMVMGKILSQHGVYFQQGLSSGSPQGWLTRGYQMSPLHDNASVPFASFHHGELIPVD